MPKKLDWQKDKCPICGKEYLYLGAYKPVTCGAYVCIREAHKRGLIYKEVTDAQKGL